VTLTPAASAVDPATITDITITWGDGQVTTGCVSGQAYSHTYAPAGGTFGIYATATDSNALSDDSAITQVVVDPNTSPICAFTATVGPDNRTVTINANASSDPDGTITGWRFLPGNGAGWIDGTVGQPLVYPYPTHGTYTGTVEVTDDAGATATQQAIIDVENVAPICVLSPVSVGSDHASFTFHLRESSDSDGTLVSARWRLDDGEWHAASLTEDISGTAPHGTYALTAEVTDDDGAVATAVTVVSLINAPPVASASWAVDQNIITLTEASTDEDGTVVAVAVTWGDDHPDEALAPGGRAVHMYAAEGMYLVTLVATDDDGAQSSWAQAVVVDSLPIPRPRYAGQSPGTVTLWEERTLPTAVNQAPGSTAHWQEEERR
jgi:PKD repeat protein